MLTIEGWANDHVLAQALAEYDRNAYRHLYVTGGPIERGSVLMQYKDYATMGVARITSLRPDLRDEVTAVQTPAVRTDRTLASAMALRDRLRADDRTPTRLNIICVGTHARRSRNVFREAFGGDAEVGVIAIDDNTYDSDRWWTTSLGFRVVTGELLAYLHSLVN